MGLYFSLLFCMAVELDFSPCGRGEMENAYL
jgi:hypothetical protein